MKYNTVSLFIIGTELTRGIIEDKHTSRLCTELTHLGFEVLRSIIVPDDGSTEKMLDRCLADSDIVIITGGLGPTSDDMTRRIIADEAGVKLVLDQRAWDALYKRVGERIHGANERQAYIPEGFELLENPHGTAPGFMGYVKRSRRQVLMVSMPGPPGEMQPMFFNLVLPRLALLKGHLNPERDEYSVYLIPESKLEELCARFSRPGIIWGTRFQQYKISLYLSGGTDEDRRGMEADLKAAIGEDLIAEGERDIIDALCDRLKSHGMTISTAESCTGGWFSKTLTDRGGASQWYMGGVASYSEQAKAKLLGVPEKTMADYSVYSHQCAISMAEGVRRSLGSTIGVSITGVAGPDGGTTDNPIGTVYFGFAGQVLPSQSVRLSFSSLNRDYIRKRATVAAAVLTLMYLNGVSLLDRTSKWQYI